MLRRLIVDPNWFATNENCFQRSHALPHEMYNGCRTDRKYKGNNNNNRKKHTVTHRDRAHSWMAVKRVWDWEREREWERGERMRKNTPNGNWTVVNKDTYSERQLIGGDLSTPTYMSAHIFDWMNDCCCARYARDSVGSSKTIVFIIQVFMFTFLLFTSKWRVL